MINKIFIPKKTKILLLFVIAFFLMLSCTQPSLPTISATQIIETPTSTPPETLTSERTLTSPQVHFEVRSLCPEVGLDISKIPDLMGTIVLGGDDISIKDQNYSPDEGQKSILLFWNIGVDEKMKYQLLEEQKYYYFATSPDKEKLAFTIGKTLSMPSDVIVLTNHLEEKKFILPDDWTLFTWQNNEKLLIRQLRLYGENNDLVALNSLGGELQVLPSNFPNIYTAEPLGIWGALTIFDPTTSLVLYPERKENELISVLWDVQNSKEIVSIVGVSSSPRWAPDGGQLLLVVGYEPKLHETHDEIFLIKPQSGVIRSTFFKDYFENNQIDLPVWSPNGRYIAFWISTLLPIKTARLAVLDTATLQVDLFCNEINPYPYRFGSYNTLGYSYSQVNSAPPIWSPDNKYLLIEDYENFTSNTYLFDIQNHTITQIAENARPVSWMEK